jgi:CubicO group peptidase (beta-lactamase class C family)
MYTFNSKTETLIRESTKGKKYIKLNIGVMVDDQALFKTFGENGEIAFENNIYEIGSITKVFTTSLLAKYVFQGILRLNDPINKYIPKLNSNNYYPSLQRIATHSSGYPGRYPLSYWKYFNMAIDYLLGKRKFKKKHPFSMDYNRMIRLIQKSKLKDKDYKWEYSNFGVALLGYIIGIVSETGYWDTMDAFLTNDLELKNSYLGTIDDKNLKGFDIKNRACGNWKYGKNELMAPAGAISSTVEDLVSFAKLNIYEEKRYFKFCHEKYTNGSKWFDMGLGWWLDKNNNNILSHAGNTGCFCSFLGIDKEKRIAVALLSNYQFNFGLPSRIGHMLLNDIQKDI